MTFYSDSVTELILKLLYTSKKKKNTFFLRLKEGKVNQI